MKADSLLWGAVVFIFGLCICGTINQIRLDWQLDQLSQQIEHLAGQARRFEDMASEWE